MRKDVGGGMVGLIVGLWFCFIFILVYYVSVEGVSDLFGELFCIVMLFLPCRFSESLIVYAVIGVLAWGVVGFLIGSVVRVMMKRRAEREGASVTDSEQLASGGEKEKSRGNVGSDEFKKSGKILDAKIVKRKERSRLKNLEIKRDLEKLGARTSRVPSLIKNRNRLGQAIPSSRAKKN